MYLSPSIFCYFWEKVSDVKGKQFLPPKAILVENGTIVPPKLPKRNLREKGANVEGGHEFTNRWAFGKKAEVTDPSGVRYYTAFQSDYSGIKIASDYSPLTRGENFWDGEHLYTMYLVHVPAYSYWRVFCDCWIIRNYNVPMPSPRRWATLVCKRLNATYNFYGDAGYQSAVERYESIKADALLHYDQCTWRQESQSIMGLDALEIPSEDPRFSLAPEYWADSIELGIGAGKLFNQLVSEAYMDAFSGLPDLSGMNNAVNAIQLIQAGLSILGSIKNPKLAIGSAKDAWLAYRYSYGTTKSDLKEVADYFSRAADLIDVDRVHSNGTAEFSLGADDSILVRCSIEVGLSELLPLKSTIERYGLQMDGYALWDLVPYSFVADWFLDVGGALERARSANFARRLKKACWCSLERRWVNEFGYREIYYHRFVATPNVSYLTLQKKGVSGETIVKRGLDSLALFT